MLVGHMDLDNKSSRKRRIPSEGDEYSTAQGYIVKVLEYVNSSNVLVKFNDKNGTELRVSSVQLKRGNLTNPYHPTVYGKGYIGIGPYESRSSRDKMNREYTLWCGILERCYNEEFHENSPTYKGCLVCEEWHNFQNFAKWCNEQKGFEQKGWHLDKDIIKKGNKIYCPEFCAFVPREINSFPNKRKALRGEFLIGVCRDKESSKFMAQGNFKGFHRKFLGYFETEFEAFLEYKRVKELHAKFLAEKYRDCLDERIVEALMKYEVGEND